MNFFFHQPEILSTINLILGSRIGPWSTVLVLSVCFIILAIIGYLLAKKFYWSPINTLFIIAAIVWLPLFAQFSYSSIIEFNDTWFVLNLPEREQIIWRYCRIDNYQNLGDNLCNVYFFIEGAREVIPKDSKIAFAPSDFGIYLTYYLYGDYQVIEPSQADYLLVFRPVEVNQDWEKQFTVMRDFAPGQLILKRNDK